MLTQQPSLRLARHHQSCDMSYLAVNTTQILLRYLHICVVLTWICASSLWNYMFEAALAFMQNREILSLNHSARTWRAGFCKHAALHSSSATTWTKSRAYHCIFEVRVGVKIKVELKSPVHNWVFKRRALNILNKLQGTFIAFSNLWAQT